MLEAVVVAAAKAKADRPICILSESALILSDSDTHSLFLNLRLLHSLLGRAENLSEQVPCQPCHAAPPPSKREPSADGRRFGDQTTA